MHFVPGNEAECRRQLDRVVAADERTYTLGDPTGPLVILRIPDKDAIPPETHWEGDLPGTTLATPADIMLRAERLKWMQRAGGKSENRIVRTGPQRAFVNDYIPQMRGSYGAAPLRGVVRVPRIADTGEVYFFPGYDPKTGRAPEPTRATPAECFQRAVSVEHFDAGASPWVDFVERLMGCALL